MIPEPRWLSPDATGAYIGVRVERLRPLVRAGRIPPPSYHLGPTQPRWDRLALDAAFEGEQKSATPDAQAVAQRVADDIRKAAHSGGRNRRRVHLPAEVGRKGNSEGG